MDTAWNHVKAIPQPTVGEPDRSHLAKRVFDVALAAALVLVLLPLFALIAVAIKLDSPGPALFVQDRVGSRRRSHHGRSRWEACTFRFYKFRSMAHNADQSLHRAHIDAFVRGRLDEAAASGHSVKLTRDRRVTRVGRVLRWTSLDELPQLVNVLKGDMSLVGPRPVPEYEVVAYEPWHRERLAALPGLTGLWQVRGRGRVGFTDMVNLDIEYVRHRTLWLDIKLLVLTIPAVLSGRGAG